MSYYTKIEYEIIPAESFSVLRGCPGCGRKTSFKNTKKFRVNANGNKLDVWLIYQCEKCKHTLNLTIYERQKVSSIPGEEYRRFLDNDERLAEIYGKSMGLFSQNKAEVDAENMKYQFVKKQDGQDEAQRSDCAQQTVLTIHNPYGLKIRPEKQIAEVLNLSRSQVQKMVKEERMKVERISPQAVSVHIRDGIRREPE